MFWDQFNVKLFRPLCSPHGRVYAQALWFLYNRMVVNWYESTDWTPKDCREAIQQCLLEMNQRIDWSEEDPFELGVTEVSYDETDDASRIYRYFKESGWIREIEEMGYRRIAYMPKQASGLLAAFDDLTRVRRSNIGARCQNIYLALKQALDDPKNNGIQVEVAAEHAREFCTQLSTMAASCRELAHGIMEETVTAKVLSKFFNDFIKGSLLEDYSTLKSRDHPYRYRAATLELVNKTLTNDLLLEALENGISASHGIQSNTDITAHQQSTHEMLQRQLRQDLQDIYRCFQRIDEIMQKIEHYRCTMTRRTREALQYAMSTPVSHAQNLDEIIQKVAAAKPAEDDTVPVPSTLYRDEYLSSGRGYRPRRVSAAAEILPVVKGVIPQKDIEFNRLMDAYYHRRAENKDRLRDLIERYLGEKDSITTDDIDVNNLDDFIAFLQLRDLLHDAVPPSGTFYELLEDYEVDVDESKVTENKYVVAPQLIVRRRRKSLEL